MKLNRKKFTHWLTRRYQVVIRNEADLAEKSTIRLNYPKIFLSIFFLWMFFTGLSWVVSRVVLRNFFDPHYKARQQEEKIEKLYETVAQLEQHNVDQEKLFQGLQNALAGNVEEVEPRTDDGLPGVIEKKLPRHPMEQKKEATVNLTSPVGFPSTEEKPYQRLLDAAAYQLPSLSFVSPVEGRITTHFNLAEGHYGIDMVGVKQAPIRAIAAGRVVLANWTVETGWILVIQHEQGLLSVYKHNEILFKKEGNVVKSGQVVALMGNTGEFSTGPHLHFELWHNSEPLNPEDFMVF